MTNLDDADTAGIVLDPQGGLTVNESGSSQVVQIELSSEPTDDVVLELVLSDPSEATLSQTGFTFSPANWNVPRQLTVTGRDDAVDDGDIAFEIRVGHRERWTPTIVGSRLDPIPVLNVDDDTAGISLTVNDATTDENGDTASFTVVLDSQPTAPVSIPLEFVRSYRRHSGGQQH